MELSPHTFMHHYEKISFYVVAHADDWQLFMQPRVYKDIISPGCKVILIITTAGDAGMDERFWKAREEGSKSSLRFCLAPLGINKEGEGEATFDHYSIHFSYINNTTTYFLRLPDGNVNGNGFDATWFKSLSKFKRAEVNAITAIDHSATYGSWRDLVNILELIITEESKGILNRWIHYLNPDESNNPGDHADHIATGQALQEMNIIKSLRQVLYTGYSVCSAGDQLTSGEMFFKTAMFAAYEKAVYDLSGYSTIRENDSLYKNWCSKTARCIEFPGSI